MLLNDSRDATLISKRLIMKKACSKYIYIYIIQAFLHSCVIKSSTIVSELRSWLKNLKIALNSHLLELINRGNYFIICVHRFYTYIYTYVVVMEERKKVVFSQDIRWVIKKEFTYFIYIRGGGREREGERNF